MNALAGRTIVITRSAEQAVEMSALVSSFGAIPVIVPLIEVIDEANGMDELTSLDPDKIDWIVVTSPNGARRVASLIVPDATTPLVAAVGAATASALPRCELVARDQSALGLLEVFPRGPGRVVVVQAVGAEQTLSQGLVELGWDVGVIRPYRTVHTRPSAEERLAALAADAVLFASGSAARGWVEVFGRHTPPAVVAIGDQTAAAAERAGLKISAISADHSMHGMLVALSRYFSDRN
ncbi:MAG: uroporphyrinogen-III synthase [Ilumatobacteraceae bacterium]